MRQAAPREPRTHGRTLTGGRGLAEQHAHSNRLRIDLRGSPGDRDAADAVCASGGGPPPAPVRADCRRPLHGDRGLSRSVRQPRRAHRARPARCRFVTTTWPTTAACSSRRSQACHSLRPRRFHPSASRSCWRAAIARSTACHKSAWDLFRRTPESWERVQAVLDWVHANVEFGYQFARPTRPRHDVVRGEEGRLPRLTCTWRITMLRGAERPGPLRDRLFGRHRRPAGCRRRWTSDAYLEVYLGCSLVGDGRA